MWNIKSVMGIISWKLELFFHYLVSGWERGGMSDPEKYTRNTFAYGVTSKCWNLCADAKTKESTLTDKEQECFKHCTHRYLDVVTMIKNNMDAQFLETTSLS